MGSSKAEKATERELAAWLRYVEWHANGGWTLGPILSLGDFVEKLRDEHGQL